MLTAIFVPNFGCRTELQRTLVLEALIFLTTAVSTFVKGMLMLTRVLAGLQLDRWIAARPSNRASSSRRVDAATTSTLHTLAVVQA